MGKNQRLYNMEKVKFTFVYRVWAIIVYLHRHMLHIASFTFNPFQENTYVIYNDLYPECAIVDAGCFEPREHRELQSFLNSHRLVPVMLLNTHAHIDHVLGNAQIMDTYGLPLHLHRDELATYEDANKWTAMLGMPPLTVPENIIHLQPGTSIAMAGAEWQVLFTPGHSVASVSLYQPQQNLLLAGDVLFRESIGRTDLPGGHFETLIGSIRTQLFILPDETVVYSGHGPQTTIGHEKRFNPFLI